MAETPVLEAVARGGVGKGSARTARRDGYVPGVIFGGGEPPSHHQHRSQHTAEAAEGRPLPVDLINVSVDGKQHHVICRAVQRDVVKDKPTHVDFLRLSDSSRISLLSRSSSWNREKPRASRGGVLTVVRPEVELVVTAGEIPEKLVVDLAGTDINDTIHISNIELPAGATPTITDRDFVIANIQAPSGLRSEEGEEAAAAEEAELAAAP